jgi:Na+/H+-dicarboxylate symporter
MCVQHGTQTKTFFNSATIYILMIALGIFSGLSDIAILKDAGLLISDVFIRIFKCISLPIIALSIIVTLSSYTSKGSMKNIWKRSILYTLTTTIIAASVSCLLYLVIKPSSIHGVAEDLLYSKTDNISYAQHITGLIPSNIFSPFLEHQVMGVLMIGVFVGIAIRYIQEEQAKETITNFFKGAHGIFLVITNWVVKIIPLGLFGFITTTVVQLREGMDIMAIGGYLAVILLANVIQGFVILPIWLKSNNINPFETMKGMFPALSLAFFSKSSTGTLPVTIEMAEKNLNINPKVSRFILPLCTSINMNGCAAFIFTTVIYLMQNNGMDISLGTMVLWIFVATIAAIGNAGVPMGCFFLSASLLASMNVPMALLGIILPFYSIIDMVETALNVWSDSCVAKVVNEKVTIEEDV